MVDRVKKEVLLIISAGTCVWDDLEKVKPFLSEYDTMAINYMIMHYHGHLDYAISWHSGLMWPMVQVRTFDRKENKPITIAPKLKEGVDITGRFHDGNLQTSGMYAAYAGLHMGYKKIIMAGVPFDGSGHFCDAPHETTSFYYDLAFKKDWNTVRDKADDRIRTVSGNLVNCFGEFTEEWIKS